MQLTEIAVVPGRGLAASAALCLIVSGLFAPAPLAQPTGGEVNQESADRTEGLSVEASDGVTLSGTLYLPDGGGPHPAVVVIHGSEPGSRTSPGYIRWAEMIRERGLACLIFDKRGVAESEGEYVEAPDLELPAADVRAWVELLRLREDLRKDAIGVLGRSQGGWIGPLVASQDPGVAFVVAISGPGVSPLEQNIFDKSNQLRAARLSGEELEMAEQAVRLAMTYMVTGEDRGAAETAWAQVSDKPWFTENYRGIPLFDRETLLSDPRGVTFVAHNGYDPIPALERVQVPMLAVFGGADRVVPVSLSVDRIEAAFERGGNADLTVKVFPDADHGIGVRASDGTFGFADGYPGYVLDWLEETIRP